MHVVKRVTHAMALLAAAFTLAGCLDPYGWRPPVTPAEAVHRQLLQEAQHSDTYGDVSTLRIRGQRAWAKGVIVLFTTQVPPKAQRPGFEMFGYRLVARDARTGIWTAQGGGGGGGGIPSPEELVSYGVGGQWSREGGGVTIVYGRVLSPQVRSVVARFDNGEALRDDLEDGIFALAVARQATLCELRVLGEDEQALRTIKLGPGPQERPQETPGGRCP